ncbi:putative MPP superfamily phosphohydrolase [Luteococcus japonicus]|uniref:Putative MPP superfamily phosphohydrolase n=1 Tax=Luteococcus japonicus TaxID=33984 RepID=A0A3N1ZUC5_9ACTN|nr:metallophosphoesterase [Luteococcus japonicus]ROR54396.1 putative MPP superfamily phosphohydrolase [Luteococcus japonicus]
MSARRTLTGLASGAAAVGTATLGYGLWEARQYTLQQVAVPVLPAGQEPIRVLHISDIHLLPRQKAKLEWVSRLAELEPDLVINTGDNFCSPDALEPLLDAWGSLLDRPGVFVFGSNDYRMPKFKNPAGYLAGPSNVKKHTTDELPFEDLRAAMTSRGWTDLNHARAELTVAGRRIAFRGTDDAHLNKDDYSLVAGPAVEDVDLNVAVTHAPYLRLLDAMTADGMDMIFAGHTHGGQVCLPFKGALVTNCDLDTGRVKGVSTHTVADQHGVEHTSWMHVSAGLGSSPFAPYRIACRPEATLLTLVSR